MKHIDSRKSFFILSCARSGSTSLATILNLASNGVCAIEPVPNLNVETREMMDMRLENPLEVLENTVIPRVKEELRNCEIYGEKNVTYGPFIHLLYQELGCRFVFLKRDGRDVVRSLINWHNNKFGSIYRECIDPGNLLPLAIKSVSNLPVHLDTSDYSRPRPQKGEPFYEKWEHFTRLEMCTYYWQAINNLYLEQLSKLPEDTWITLDYTSPHPNDILRVIDFLGLQGISSELIRENLNKKINSLNDRCVSEPAIYPHWSNWSVETLEKFNLIARNVMKKLGYYE